jgi:hypothetical protein
VNLDDVRFVTRGVTPEEKAAVWAVLDAQIDEESALEHAVQSPGVNAWAKSQVGLREEVNANLRFGRDYS